MCATGYQPTLDEMVEVTFTVSRRVRRIAAHDPFELSFAEYFRQVFWGSGFDVPGDFEQVIEEITLDAIELPPGEKALLSLQLPAEFVIVMDPVTHGAQERIWSSVCSTAVSEWDCREMSISPQGVQLNLALGQTFANNQHVSGIETMSKKISGRSRSVPPRAFG
jgi:hypothetical protein